MTPRALIPLILSVVVLAGCATAGGKLQPAGSARMLDMHLNTSLSWADIPAAARSALWTVDGPALNQLRAYQVKPGEHVFLAPQSGSGKEEGPRFRSGMRPDGIRDLVLDAYRLMGWSDVSARNLRPARFGEVEGLRFELDLTNTSGLVYGGTVAAAERDGKLSLLIWTAPLEHYYPRDIEAVAATLDGMRFAL